MDDKLVQVLMVISLCQNQVKVSHHHHGIILFFYLHDWDHWWTLTLTKVWFRFRISDCLSPQSQQSSIALFNCKRERRTQVFVFEKDTYSKFLKLRFSNSVIFWSPKSLVFFFYLFLHFAFPSVRHDLWLDLYRQTTFNGWQKVNL
jgi:hypothetical protein